MVVQGYAGHESQQSSGYTDRAVGCWMRLPFWSGKVALLSLSALRMRYSKAA